AGHPERDQRCRGPSRQDGRPGHGREGAPRGSRCGGRRSAARHQQARARTLRHERRAGIQERPMSFPRALCAALLFALVAACPRRTEVKPTPQEEEPPPPAPRPTPPPKPAPKPPKVAQPAPEPPPVVIVED